MNLPATRTAAAALVRSVGQKLRRRRPGGFRLKGKADLVTSQDSRAEDELRAGLPQAAFWGEEGGRSGSDAWCWVVDPLDGTTNYAHRYPHAAVSVALARDGQVELGIVYDLFRGELFEAVRGQGAWLNGRAVTVSPVASLEESLLGTGFGPDSADGEYERFRWLQQRCHGVRRSGCCSLDLCWVACGRLDGFYEWDLQPWDVAAGGLIVAEAGGRFTTLKGALPRLERGDYLASNGLLHEELTR